jgi:hypothetical protein
MCDDLFSIPLLVTAFRQPDSKTALREAFREIRRLGQEPRWRTGYQQFLVFMAYALEPARVESPWGSTGKMMIEMVIERGETVLGTFTVGDDAREATIGGITPGFYSLMLATGRVLWEGELRAEDVLWSSAYPGQPLRAAAESEHALWEPTREFRLLDGALLLSVYAGIEAGALGIRIELPENR